MDTRFHLFTHRILRYSPTDRLRIVKWMPSSRPVGRAATVAINCVRKGCPVTLGGNIAREMPPENPEQQKLTP
jgi:hypothetical protein